MNTRNLRAKYGAKLAVVASSVIAAGQALAQTAPTTGVEAVKAVKDGIGDYGPAMFGLAIVSVGVMIGVKWIKRAKGAA